MPRDLIRETPGLVTDPGPFSAPNGALYEAENVIIPRPGNIQPRGRITWYTDTSNPGTSPVHVAYWQSNVFVFYDSATNPVRRQLSATLTGPTSLTAGKTWSAATRDRLLFTSDQGVYSIDSASTSTCRRAGLPQALTPVIVGSNTGTTWLATNYATAYRFVFGRYVNGALLLSAPSPYYVVRNNSGATWRIGFTLGLPPELIAGDIIQVYRANKVTPYSSNPADEMRLRMTITLTSSDITSTFWLGQDTLDDSAWSGPSLYTNEGQQGILQSNYRPHYAVDVANYNGMAFYAGRKNTSSITLTLASMGTVADPSRAITVRTITGDITTGNNTITNVSATDITYAAVGQYLTRNTGAPEAADAYFAADTRITAVGTTTITVSTNALATQVGASLKCWDWVGVYDGSTERRIYASDTTTGKQWDSIQTSTTGGGSYAAGTWNTNYNSTGIALHVTGEFTDTSWTFERTTYSATALTVRSTKPNAWDRYVDHSTGVTTSQDGGTNRLAYSKVDEPESLPILNYVDLGSSTNEIHRVMCCGDSLFVFTTEGLWRVTGTSPETLVFDPIDPTCVLWDRRLLVSSHDQIWAFTTRGPCSVSDGGVRSICDSVRSHIDEQWNISAGATDAATLTPWAYADQAHDLVIFGASRLVGTVGTNFTWRGHVYNVATNTWTTWSNERSSRVITCASSNFAIFGCSIGFAGYSFSESTRYAGDVLFNCVPTIDTVSGTTVTINAGSGWTPTVGDAFSAQSTGTSPYHILSVSSATQFVVDRTPSVTPAQTIYPFEGVANRVRWQARTGGAPDMDKTWQELILSFEKFHRGYDITFTHEGYNSDTYFEVSGGGTPALDTFTIASVKSTYTPASAAFPMQLRRHIPAALTCDWALRPGFKMTRALAFWVLGSACITGEYVGDRSGFK